MVIKSTVTKEEQTALQKAIPQILAVSVKNLLLLGYGMSLGFPTILIPSLLDNKDSNEISLGVEATSWIASISLFCVPIGAVLSGPVTQPLGRKRAMQAINIPFLAAWTIFYFANDVWQIYFALGLGGFTGGLLEAPVLTYVAEVTQPHLRGFLSCTSSTSIIVGTLIQFLLGTFFSWRMCALLSCIVPIGAFFCLFLIPETPLWLIGKNRLQEAKQSLAWLRGWVELHEVEEEFNDMCKALGKAGHDNMAFEGNHQNTTMTKKRPSKLEVLKMFGKKNFIWPYALVSLCFFLGHFNGMSPLQVFAIKIFSAYKAQINSYHATILLGVSELVGCLVFMVLVHYVGKRKLTFVSLFGGGVCFFIVATYSHMVHVTHLFMPAQDNSTIVTTLAGGTINLEDYTWVPITFLIASAFFSYVGVRILPWILAGEVFSNETRATASGLAGAISYVFGFICNKTFLKMNDWFTLPGTFWFYSGVSFVGLVILYFTLPETEGKTLFEICEHFAGGRKIDNNVANKSRDKERGKNNVEAGKDNPNFVGDSNGKIVDESRL